MFVLSRIRKGFPYEARVITRILPSFLADFFPPQDIMNKVIGEFLSNQQPHPQLMAAVLFQVSVHVWEVSCLSIIKMFSYYSLCNIYLYIYITVNEVDMYIT